MKSAWIAMLAVALAACASTPAGKQAQTLEQKLVDHGYKLGKEVDHVERWNIDGWSRIDDQHVVFNSGPSRDYLVSVGTACSGVASATTIGFTATVDRVTKFDKLVVRDMGFTDQCPIESLHELKRLKQD